MGISRKVSFNSHLLKGVTCADRKDCNSKLSLKTSVLSKSSTHRVTSSKGLNMDGASLESKSENELMSE